MHRDKLEDENVRDHCWLLELATALLEFNTPARTPKISVRIVLIFASKFRPVTSCASATSVA